MDIKTTGPMKSIDTAGLPDSLPTLDDMLMFKLYRAWSAGNPIFTRLCEGRFNITRREWRLLAIAGQYDSLTSTRLAHVAALDAPRTSRAVGSLCRKGLLERRRDPDDARTVHISVTQRGRSLYHELMPLVASLNEVIFQDLDSGELQALGAMLDRIVSRAAQMIDDDLIKERTHRSRPSGRHQYYSEKETAQ
ncbi:MarR family winged helix-turn-helix transcriptional regulator [Pusillimonas sp. MFBS29]|uniref:MarR family winged helix-turn-helix transcriptional regulator n=1 Tax=Pusillimonas sp. MFBS29 TaxID=2886690 RepID=UPI001D120A49|nr:MarR family winged helix-turn-helix transcriptional regulator [Pusillimonas sp. MFBS29]MCC2596970.1 MarR family winged helix-turn-helix transcriptional regulator [Pusillimonas sp. MFBS29]